MSKKPKTKSFRVTLAIPAGATVTDCRDYIEDAVRNWCGGYRPAGAMGDNDPGDQLFELDKDSVRVTATRRTNTPKKHRKGPLWP